MSNREVAGLNALAQKHGGSLTTNPQTGLPEAGFLDSILPAVAGAGISYFSGGTIDPLTAAGIVGGVTALDSKDVSKGLLAGLGAYGGAGMVGGLAGLGAEAGYMPGAAGEAARQAATQEAIANGTYQSQVGTGFNNFTNAPMNSLSTLGGGSVLKGSLPILEGLAPAAADMLGGDEGDNAPEQKKGYIRKYALDPVTGQYKQVGVYEAGGDPNVDVTSEAGTAGSYGGVGQSKYQETKGMASGGTATDSQRVYDYLMGRGPNPMQFTHTARRVDYTPYMPKPITPTTPILEQQYDQYGNVINRTSGGGGQSQEQRDQRETSLNTPNPYWGGITQNQYFGLNPEQREAVDKQAKVDHPIMSGIGDLAKMLMTPGGIFLGALNDVYQKINPPPPVPPEAAYAGAYYNPFDTKENIGLPTELTPEERTQYNNVLTGQPSIYDKGLMGVDTTPKASEPSVWTDASGNAWQTGDKSPLMTGTGAATFKQQEEKRAEESALGEGESGSEPADTGFRDALMDAFQNPQANVLGPVEGQVAGLEGVNLGQEPQGSEPQGGEPQGNPTPPGPDHEGDGGGGGGDARGGYLMRGRFDQRMAHGGISGHLRPPQPFYANGKFGYKGPQVYADGGGIADLANRYNLGSYSDGGRLLKGPGDGVSDDIPATIGHGQPARLADGEFVIPARIVSEIGNGSTDAGARELYKMMDRIQAGRRKTVGKDQVAKNSKAVRHLPA
jgi:hypothetical protein